MKYRFICLLGLLALLSVPAAVSAEGMLPGLPSFSGWSCAPSHKADYSVTGKLGYLGYNRPLIFNMTAADLPVGVLNSLRLDVPVEGIWAGAWVTGTGPQRGVVACDPGEGLCLTLGGSWLFPNNKEASGDYGITITPNHFSRSWRPLIAWFTIEASASRCAWSNFSLIGGFRFDSFTAAFSEPLAVPGIGSLTDVGLLDLKSFLPYVGAETRLGAIKVGVIGFPWIFGTMIAGEGAWGGFGVAGYATGTYRTGYFTEAYAEFGRQLGLAHLSAFATYTVLHATGNCDVQVPIAAVPSRSYDFGIDRQNWIVGGKAVVGFNSPM